MSVAFSVIVSLLRNGVRLILAWLRCNISGSIGLAARNCCSLNEIPALSFITIQLCSDHCVKSVQAAMLENNSTLERDLWRSRVYRL